MFIVLKRVTCNKCKSILEYNDKFVWEGNRDFEDFICPVCKNVVATVFTDQIPVVRLIKKGDSI